MTWFCLLDYNWFCLFQIKGEIIILTYLELLDKEKLAPSLKKGGKSPHLTQKTKNLKNKIKQRLFLTLYFILIFLVSKVFCPKMRDERYHRSLKIFSPNPLEFDGWFIYTIFMKALPGSKKSWPWSHENLLVPTKLAS